MDLQLPVVVLNLLEKRGAVIDASLRGTQSQLIEVVKHYDYSLHDSVIAFETSFGGLLMPDDGNVLDRDEPYWLFGTYNCLISNAHSLPRGGDEKLMLVPIVYSPNDIIYFIDKSGKCYAEDTIEDTSASFYAESGASLICRIVFHDLLFSRNDSSIELSGLHGEMISKQFQLFLVNEASDADLHFYANTTADILVKEDFEAEQTIFSATSKNDLEKVASLFKL
jgi:hypothetical protein